MTAAVRTPVKPTRFDPRWLPLIVTTVGSFMSILDTTIVNIALPSIMRNFGSSLGNGQLVLTSYLMALAVVIPISGFLGERIGLKRLYMITLLCFTAGSALCGFAWNIPSLIVFRTIQGLGGGMLQPLGMALVFTMITPLERPYFMGLIGIPVLLGPILGPSLGGYLVEYSSWRTVFLINVPVGAIDVVLAYFLLKETPIRAAKLDLWGFVLAAIAFPMLLLGLSNGTEQGWHTPTTLLFIVTGVTALAMFIRVELRHADPMLEVRLFADPMFRLALGIQWIGFFSLFGLSFLLPLFLQTARGWGAAQTGLVLLPMGIGAFITMNIAGRQYNRLGPRPIAIAGLSVLALTTLLWSRVTATTPMLPILLLVSGRGIALGMFSQTVQMVAYNCVPDGHMPRATALVNTGQRLTGALSAAMLTTVLLFSLHRHGAPAGASVSISKVATSLMFEAFRETFLLMTALTLIAVAMACFLHDRVLARWRAESQVESAAGSPRAAAEG